MSMFSTPGQPGGISSGLASLFQQPGKGFQAPAAPRPTSPAYGGNSFLSGWAKMRGVSPAPVSDTPSWGTNSFLNGMKTAPAAPAKMPGLGVPKMVGAWR